MATFQRKLEAAFAAANAAGLKKSYYAPVLHRLLCRLGIAIRPPHFAGIAQNFLMQGVVFGACWGGAMWFAAWRHQGVPPSMAFLGTGAAGLIFGAGMAAYFRYAAPPAPAAGMEHARRRGVVKVAGAMHVHSSDASRASELGG